MAEPVSRNDPEMTIKTVLDDLKKHADEDVQSDDITMLNVYYNPE